MSNRYFGGNLTNYGEAPTTVEYLVVAGGGGGGSRFGGGGGGGGVINCANIAVAVGSATITVTAGGLVAVYLVHLDFWRW
jgi:hypothetical protein